MWGRPAPQQLPIFCTGSLDKVPTFPLPPPHPRGTPGSSFPKVQHPTPSWSFGGVNQWTEGPLLCLSNKNKRRPSAKMCLSLKFLFLTYLKGRQDQAGLRSQLPQQPGVAWIPPRRAQLPREPGRPRTSGGARTPALGGAASPGESPPHPNSRARHLATLGVLPASSAAPHPVTCRTARHAPGRRGLRVPAGAAPA